MASGRLGALKPAAATPKTLYKPGAGVVAVVRVTFANQAASSDLVRIGILQNASLDQAIPTTDAIAWDRYIAAKGDLSMRDSGSFGMIELNGNNNDQLVVQSTSGNVSFVCFGDEGAV